MVDGALSRAAGDAAPAAARPAPSFRPRLARHRAAAVDALRSLPWWLVVTLVFLLSRVVTTAIMLSFAARQPENPWTAASPDYFSFARIWDGHWYYIISVVGYPSELPIDAQGYVAENAWAFMPAYPTLIRGIVSLTGIPFSFVAVTLSVAFALAAALLVYRIAIRFLPDASAMFAVVLFCLAPLSPILQVAYAESMHLFLLALALLLLLDRRYGMLFPVVAIMSVTRPSGLAFALALGFHVIHRFLTRERDAFPARERAVVVALGLFSILAGFAWFLAAWAVTGSFTAYTDTELAWRAPYIGHQHLIPFAPWIQGATWWLGFPLGVIVLAIVLVAFVAFMASPWVRRIPVDLRFWVVAYALYLLAVFFPQSSTFRLLVPLFPLLAALAVPRHPIFRIVLVVACIIGQWVWVDIAWWFDSPDWTPP